MVFKDLLVTERSQIQHLNYTRKIFSTNYNPLCLPAIWTPTCQQLIKRQRGKKMDKLLNCGPSVNSHILMLKAAQLILNMFVLPTCSLNISRDYNNLIKRLALAQKIIRSKKWSSPYHTQRTNHSAGTALYKWWLNLETNAISFSAKSGWIFTWAEHSIYLSFWQAPYHISSLRKRLISSKKVKKIRQNRSLISFNIIYSSIWIQFLWKKPFPK